MRIDSSVLMFGLMTGPAFGQAVGNAPFGSKMLFVIGALVLVFVIVRLWVGGHETVRNWSVVFLRSIAAVVLGSMVNIWLAGEVLQMTPGFYSSAGYWAVFYFVFGWLVAYLLLVIAYMIAIGARKMKFDHRKIPISFLGGSLIGYYLAMFFVNNLVR